MRIDNSKHMIAKTPAERLASSRRCLRLSTSRLPPAKRVDESRSILRDESLSASQNQIAKARPAPLVPSNVDEDLAGRRWQNLPGPRSELHASSGACSRHSRVAQLKAEPASVAGDEDRNRV